MLRGYAICLAFWNRKPGIGRIFSRGHQPLDGVMLLASERERGAQGLARQPTTDSGQQGARSCGPRPFGVRPLGGLRVPSALAMFEGLARPAARRNDLWADRLSGDALPIRAAATNDLFDKCPLTQDASDAHSSRVTGHAQQRPPLSAPPLHQLVSVWCANCR